jgi:hypothetical protein
MSAIAFGAQNSCDLPNYKICVDSSTVDLSAECSQNGGTVGTVCATANRIGTCLIQQGDQSVTGHYYTGFQDAEGSCAENGGVFTRG